MNKVVLLILALLSLQTSFAIAQNCNYDLANNKAVIMIDLDGVLDEYEKYDKSKIPKIRNGAKDFIKNLYEMKKYDLVLFTTRSPKLATFWLIDNNIDKYFIDVTNVKYPAKIYIDDRAIQFNGDYNNTLKEIETFKTYWKK